MLGQAFEGLAWRLETILLGMEEPHDGGGTDAMALGLERHGELCEALAGPAQGRLGVPARAGVDQRQQVGPEGGIVHREGLAPPTRPPDTPRGR